MTRAGLVFLPLCLVALAARPVAAKELKAGQALKGVAILSSVVPGDVSEKEVLAFVQECGIDLVVFDFAWITHHWPRTDMKAIDALARRLDQKGVVVAAMYRPRALRPSDADVHYAVGADGKIPAHHLDLCFAHEDSVRWGSSWGSKVLSLCPSIRHVILYNVRSPCHCERCRDGKASGHVTRFLGRCRDAWPDVRIGHVGLGLEHEEAVDFFCPFLSVRKGTDPASLVGAVRWLAQRAKKKPVVPLAKICWASATRNGTEDVVDAIRACGKQRLGFVLWYYSWIFHSEDGRYDPASVVAALGGDPKRLAPFFERKQQVQANADGRQWIYFDSREMATGPRLRVRSKDVPASADSVLISYLADRVWGAHRSLSITLADTNRVLLRFPPAQVRGAKRAKLHLTVHKSQIPPTAPFGLAVHRVTKPWSEGETNWNNQPAFEKKPLTVVQVDPERSALAIDLGAWVRSGKVRHGLLLKVAKPVPAGRGPIVPSGPWTQPEIRTGTPFSDTIPWARDLEEALARAKDERKPVLATVVPVGDRRWVSGYRDAEAVWKDQKAHPWGDERAMTIDAGLMKERVMMAALFTDPEIASLVKAHFVPVRLRLHTYVFDEIGSRQFTDPLQALGTSGLDAGGPALVFARASGKTLHVCRRMGVFSAPMVRAMLKAVLRKAGVKRPEPFEVDRPANLTSAWKLTRKGDFEHALRRIDALTPPKAAPWRWETLYLRGLLEDKLGNRARAEESWRSAVAGDPQGPWGGKAAVRLSPHGPRLDEWESLLEFESDPLAEQTEAGHGKELEIDEVMGRAVDYLLSAQRPDGSWRDPFLDPHPMSGPGSKYDKSVPRTGLVVDALLRMRSRRRQRRKELDGAGARGIAYVGKFADAPQTHTWKLTYALHLQVAILRSDLPASRKAEAKRRAARLVATLGKCQHDGGWSYMPPPRIHSFNTAPVLLLLTELEDLGVKVPDAMTEAAATFLEGLRRKEEPREFAYASSVRHKAVRSSSCRTALCELALLEHAGDRSVERLRAGVKLFFEHEDSVRKTTKVFENYFALTSLHDAYHYYFGHYYTARALARLPKGEAMRFAKKQMEIVLAQSELDGSFVDAQMQGKSYSTAMALLTLLEDLRHAER
ncbi:MAG: DNRLRE domain-containing protein [Planctomycetota bacterium]|jgi:hypothetical protein